MCNVLKQTHSLHHLVQHGELNLEDYVKALQLEEGDIQELEDQDQTLTALDLELGFDWRSMGVSREQIYLHCDLEI